MNHLTNQELLSLISAGRVVEKAGEVVQQLVKRLEALEAAHAEELEDLRAETAQELDETNQELLEEQQERQAAEDQALKWEKKHEVLDARLLDVYLWLKEGAPAHTIQSRMEAWDDGKWIDDSEEELCRMQN